MGMARAKLAEAFIGSAQKTGGFSGANSNLSMPITEVAAKAPVWREFYFGEAFKELEVIAIYEQFYDAKSMLAMAFKPAFAESMQIGMADNFCSICGKCQSLHGME